MRAYSSFGKLIFADEPSEPIYSIGNANRFAQAGMIVTIPKDTPGPKYSPSNEEKYKYKSQPKWKIGKGIHPPLYIGEKYEYFNHEYDPDKDFGTLKKIWDKKPGGVFGLEARIKPDIKEGTPGPGRYEPSLTQTRPRNLAYFFGEKTSNLSLRLLTGTNDKVGPGKYPVEKAKYTSIHKTIPIWGFGKEKRKELYNRVWTKNETYETYSSVKEQIRTHKRSEPRITMTKSTRECEKNRGVFPTMMENRPTRIRLELPKF